MYIFKLMFTYNTNTHKAKKKIEKKKKIIKYMNLAGRIFKVRLKMISLPFSLVGMIFFPLVYSFTEGLAP